MKKVIYIGIAVFGLALASCSKQDIQPNSPDPVVPVWKSNSSGAEGGSTVTPSGNNGPTDGSNITDPTIDDSPTPEN